MQVQNLGFMCRQQCCSEYPQWTLLLGRRNAVLRFDTFSVCKSVAYPISMCLLGRQLLVQDIYQVSVVIPTSGRRAILPSIHSALAQDGVQTEVIVVVNGVAEYSLPEMEGVRVLFSPPEQGANGARQKGIEASQYKLVALLDDDDSWSPAKLAKQLGAVEAQGLLEGAQCWVAATSVRRLYADGSHDDWPTRDPGRVITDAAEYLFVRKGLRRRGENLQTSTFLFPRELALTFPFDGNLRIHQDWDWIIAATSTTAPIVFVYEPLTIRGMNTVDSVSASSKWEESLAWGRRALNSARRRVRGEFFFGPPLTYALRSREWGAAFICLKSGLLIGPPSPATIIAGVLRTVAAIGRRV